MLMLLLLLLLMIYVLSLNFEKDLLKSPDVSRLPGASRNGFLGIQVIICLHLSFIASVLETSRVARRPIEEPNSTRCACFLLGSW